MKTDGIGLGRFRFDEHEEHQNQVFAHAIPSVSPLLLVKIVGP
jgi:hypothetical protein